MSLKDVSRFSRTLSQPPTSRKSLRKNDLASDWGVGGDEPGGPVGWSCVQRSELARPTWMRDQQTDRSFFGGVFGQSLDVGTHPDWHLSHLDQV